MTAAARPAAAPSADVSPADALPIRRVHLSAAGVSLVIDASGDRMPAIVHWGRELGTLTAQDAATLTEIAGPAITHNTIDVPLRVGILPQLADGWVGTPGISGARADGSAFSPLLTVRDLRVESSVGADGAADAAGSAADEPAAAADGTRTAAADGFCETGAARVEIDLADESVGIAVRLDVEMLASGLVRVRAALTDTTEAATPGTDAARAPYVLEALTPMLPIPLDATELLDFGGRWTRERTPQRSPLVTGTHLRENRRGRTGPDAAHVLHAGTPGFGFRHGEIWAVHTAFSGDHRHLAERSSRGVQLLGGGELLLPGEGRLEPGGAYETPWLYGAHASDGLDGIARRFHTHLRSRPQHVDAQRPVTLNVWEAVYFNHDLERLRDLADRAAALGVERFVLDDGWFGSRRDDTSGLGDWVVSDEVWPDGLTPLIEHVTGLGMQFGLWFEPEMVNEDSDVARAHPEWIMAPSPDRLPEESRSQQVLNLAIPEAFDHVHSQMRAILAENDIAYIKWDHNRDLIEAATRDTGAAAMHAQTLALYRLLDALKEEFPGLEIESCSSGGARVDLGVLERTDRVWVSDCIDPLERQLMNRWTAQLIPLELMGTHIASGASHTTGRLHSLSFRAASALFGHLGIEWDLAHASAQEMDELRAWIALYKAQRELLLTGEYVRADRGEDSLWVYGVVSPERDRALYELAAVGRADVAPIGSVRLPGLDPARRYRVRPLVVGEAPAGLYWPAWAREGASTATDRIHPGISAEALVEAVEMPGSLLVEAGVAAPIMYPESAVLLEVTAV